MELQPLSSYYLPFDEMSNKKSTEQMRNAFLLKLDTQYSTHTEKLGFFFIKIISFTLKFMINVGQISQTKARDIMCIIL